MASRHPLINTSLLSADVREALDSALHSARTVVEDPGREPDFPGAAYALLVALSASLNSPSCVPSFPVDLEGRRIGDDRIDLFIGLRGAASDRVAPLPIPLLLTTFAACEDAAAAQARFIAILIPWLPKGAAQPKGPQDPQYPSPDSAPPPYRFRPAAAAAGAAGGEVPAPLEAKFWSRRGVPRYYVKDWHEAVGVTLTPIDETRRIAQFDGRRLTATQFAALKDAAVFVDEFGVVHVERYGADDVLPAYEAAQRINLALVERGLVVTSSAPVPDDLTFEDLVTEALE